MAANWAQSSGSRVQNVVFTTNPSPGRKHWEGRYGASVVKHSDVSVSFATANDVGEIYIMGGDVYDGRNHSDQSIYRDPGLIDIFRTHGLKNDVWKTTGTEWTVKGDIRKTNGVKIPVRYPSSQYRRQKMPRVDSNLVWQTVTPGRFPDPGLSYDSWIICDDFFASGDQYKALRIERKCCAQTEVQEGPDAASCVEPLIQWSPRRHHTSVTHGGYLYVMGGRAREYVSLHQDRSLGGIRYPDIEDSDTGTIRKEHQFSTPRETIVYKSDVWRSRNGQRWELVNPGCKAPQLNLARVFGNVRSGRVGTEANACSANDDCYGAEFCDLTMKTCVCSIWSPRELHSAISFGDYIYVVGGFASRLYSQRSLCGNFACGDTDASAYRAYLSDVWKSSDGETWTELKFESSFGGRGGHQSLVFTWNPGSGPDTYLWIFGGRGGDNDGNSVRPRYYKDIWRAKIQPDDGSIGDFEEHSNTPQWSERMGHTVTLESASGRNGNKRLVYLVGGIVPTYKDVNKQIVDGSMYSNEIWTWNPDDRMLTDWLLDYTRTSRYRVGNGATLQNKLGSIENPTPSYYYINPFDSLTVLRRFVVPADITAGDVNVNGKTPGLLRGSREYLPSHRINELNQMGLFTIQDLANADVYTLLILRGFDYPGVQESQKHDFYHICSVRALALAIVKKCSNDTTVFPDYYGGEGQMPWNVENEFGGDAPSKMTADWHGRDFSDYNPLREYDAIVEKWDGCTEVDLPSNERNPGNTAWFKLRPNVNGIGFVDQVNNTENPLNVVQELHCRINPGTRAFHSSLFFKDRMYIFGGKQSDLSFGADSWYRDDHYPSAIVREVPSPDLFWRLGSTFFFDSEEQGCFFEYRLWDPYAYMQLVPWTPVVKKADVAFLDWRMGGPGSGIYVLYVRAVDPAGNRDERYVMCPNDVSESTGICNMFQWYYISPFPVDLLALGISAFIVLAILAYLEYRRRLKRAAMERYAMKRMRRKFKAMQRDQEGGAVDWRTLYNESKTQDLTKRKSKKQDREEKKRAREKERRKRENEKENIKKKLKAGKDHKEKMKKQSEKDYEKREKRKTRKSDRMDGVDTVDSTDQDTRKGLIQGNASKEAGTKQRKTNKRFKNYEKEQDINSKKEN